MDEAIKKAEVLIEALPYIREFRKKVFVIKYGGSILSEDSIRKGVLEDLVFLSFMGIKTVLVHGGGPNISEKLKKLGKKTEFVDGMRVTDSQTLLVVEEELNELNKLLVNDIKKIGGQAVGLSGKDHGIIRSKKLNGQPDLGFVGVVAQVNKELIEKELKASSIVVISPMGVDDERIVYNINADEAASHIAAVFEAEKFVLLTNVRGVMRDPENNESLIGSLRVDDINTLIDQNVIQSGMIPKVNACLDALKGNVKKTHIIDARIPHALLLEIFTDQGVGTEIVNNF
ncbi:MAG: acetylglutamate kinase [Candidatus Omnitrophica bacterium CG1_02_44_16]|nr:MAG: acetylglutamate kinase [Candidatus Omnitrophica bacterium CG1_02_44_16]PIY82075.1 MAG: acetylglutamate kinase [Candidatus Omnitrophica bacterium CG_4_10_14_0_8_um_filter_44_12]